MESTKRNLEKERETICTMIKMYCKRIHNNKQELCQECLELFNYAEKRLDNCRFGEEKPTCEKCPNHCYKPDMREKIRKVI